MGSVHGPSQCPYELWAGKHPDLIKLPTIPFGSVVVTHVPVDKQTVETGPAILHYAVGNSLKY